MSGKNISIIGNGVYGQALAHLFGKKHRVQVYGRTLRNDREYHIEDFPLYGRGSDYVIISITTGALSEVLPKIAPSISPGTSIILAMKGLTASNLLPIEECRKYENIRYPMILSGPGFAEEILQDISVHLILAKDPGDKISLEDFLLPGLTLDYSDDILGVSWCGVLKNIYAIGAGMAASSSENFQRETYTAQVVQEMSEILPALGGMSITASGQAGKGAIWICTTPYSRNFRFGMTLDPTVTEGVEGYGASYAFLEKYRPLLDAGKYPLLSSIIGQVTRI